MSTDPVPFRRAVGSRETPGSRAATPISPWGDGGALHLERAGSHRPEQMGPVLLVGAGPGDPDLLTLDGEQALGAAREIVADRCLVALLDALVAEGVIGPLDDPTAPASPPITSDDAGPGPVCSPMTGPVVSWVDDDHPADASLFGALGRGAGVVRLYRGDPWFHPAGDAERAALRMSGVDVVVVPGVAEELAMTAAAGVPVQVRTVAVTTTFSFERFTGPAGSSCRPATRAPTGELAASGDAFSPRSEPDTDGPDAPFAHSDLVVPADAAHTLVVRTADLAATATRLADAARRDGIDARRPAAALPTERHRGPAVEVRASLADLAVDAPPGGGVVVVGLVAALDTRLVSSTAAAGTEPGHATGPEEADGSRRGAPKPISGAAMTEGPGGATTEAEPSTVVAWVDGQTLPVGGVT